MAPTEAPCRYLDWDSEFFSRRIARITTSRLSAETLACVLRWCDVHSIECAYFFAAPDDDASVRLAEDHGFRLVDVRLTLGRSLARGAYVLPTAEATPTRPARLEDVPALRAIARVNHHDTRFYHDGNFPRSQCDALYETWIERSCAGWADCVRVTERAGRPVGYVSCHLAAAGAGRIGLLGVDAAVQGRGVAGSLVASALGWFASRGTERVTVTTQGRNARAQRLYQRAGFLSTSIELSYHRWFGPSADGRS